MYVITEIPRLSPLCFDMSNTPILSMKDISKTYILGEVPFQVLHNVSLDVDEGEFISVLGPSGSGKSTMMNIIGCLDRADSGTYTLGGYLVDDLTENRLAELRCHKIGFVFQSFQLLQRVSAVENVILSLIYARFPKKQRYDLAMTMLERVGLADKSQNLPQQLSGGQQQRVAIARAMVTNPAVILADEPTGALDQKTGEQIMSLFSELNSEGKTIIMITHSAKMSTYASRVIHLVDGRVYSETEYTKLGEML